MENEPIIRTDSTPDFRIRHNNLKFGKLLKHYRDFVCSRLVMKLLAISLTIIVICYYIVFIVSPIPGFQWWKMLFSLPLFLLSGTIVFALLAPIITCIVIPLIIGLLELLRLSVSLMFSCAKLILDEIASGMDVFSSDESDKKNRSKSGSRNTEH